MKSRTDPERNHVYARGASPGTLPTCPRCGSKAKRCYRPSGHDAAEWHVEREDLVARDCLCPEICGPWLDKRMSAAR